MPVKFANFAFSFLTDRKKHVFVPNKKSYEVGRNLKRLIEEATIFDPFYFHLRNGGHVAALHEHRNNRHFARVDIKNFFYSISRNRVARVLHEIGIPKAGYYAKYSCVKNPYQKPSYSLPYGFVQSPILATAVLSRSNVSELLRCLHENITISVYMDDIAISSSEKAALEEAYEKLKIAISASGFEINLEKTTPPTETIEIFNCELEFNHATVTETRQAIFYTGAPSPAALEAFKRYCQSVERGNGSLPVAQGPHYGKDQMALRRERFDPPRLW